MTNVNIKHTKFFSFLYFFLKKYHHHRLHSILHRPMQLQHVHIEHRATKDIQLFTHTKKKTIILKQTRNEFFKKPTIIIKQRHLIASNLCPTTIVANHTNHRNAMTHKRIVLHNTIRKTLIK